MKAFKYIAYGALSLMMVGCSDGFLKNESPTAMIPSDVYSNEIRTEQAIFGVYERMGANNGYRNRIACGFQGLNTDIEWSTKSSDSKSGVLMTYDCPIEQSDVSSTSGSDVWAYLNTMIERSNDIIEGIEEYGNYKENASMRYFLGEALFLRSFAYLEQVKYWGDVPARFVSIDKEPDGINSKKVDRDSVFEHLRIDLTRAAEYMPWSEEIPVSSAKNNVGRPSKAAALGLLARANLMYAGKAVRPLTIDDPDNYEVTFNIKDATKRVEVYQQALEACAEIIKHENYKLAENFETPFRQICSDMTDYSKMEHIWVMPFADGARGQVLNYNAPKISSTAQSTLPGHLHGYGKGGSSGGHICVTPTLIYKFDKDDKRRDVTYVLGQWEYDDASSNVFKDSPEKRSAAFDGLSNDMPRLYQKVGDVAHYYCGKYRFEWMGAGRELTSTDDGVDFPILRYADILLMFAEAEIGGISGDRPNNTTTLKGVDQFNKIRRRAGVSECNGEPTMAQIMDERAFEFCGEYIRKYDLMRWGNLREVMVAHQEFARNMANDLQRNNTLNIGDTLYFHYVFNKEIGGWEAKADGGLAVGEKTRPTSPYTYLGIAKNIFDSESKGAATNATNYPIFKSEEQLESRQYWPIFSHNVDISNNTLWNNYGYK